MTTTPLIETMKAAIETIHTELVHADTIDEGLVNVEALGALDALAAFVDAHAEQAVASTTQLPTTEPELKALLLAIAERLTELPPDTSGEHLTTYVLLIGTSSEPGPFPRSLEISQTLRGYTSIEGRMIDELLKSKSNLAMAAIRSGLADM